MAKGNKNKVFEDETVNEELGEEVKQECENVENKVTEETADDTAEKLKADEDKYLRLAAEYDNYQKRTQREKEARYADAVIDTVAAFLPIGDNLERALTVEVQSEDAKQLMEGVKLVQKQLDEVLKKLNITAIDTVGQQFDPNFHNAVMHVEDETIDDNTIVEEFMKGYMYKDNRVVRHSMVKVAN